MSHVVLVHGAWAGSWVWDTVTEPLTAAGHTPHALSLPGVGRWADRDVTLDDVAGHVAEYVAGLEGTVFVVGHSGGGIVATQVAEMMPDRVAGVAYVAGMMLPSGVDFGQLCDGLGLEPP
ncbi:MAG: alpha/beta fold hydrolase, partial [Rhodococcus sp. (in: high G+C Gram-positive bacteria)]|uniref:alpha/beta fold hydrolase n=2 Tax=Rhodococcus TaxID=1827 RepID=UPI003D9BC2A5